MNFILVKGFVDDVFFLYVFNLLGYIIVLFYLIFIDLFFYDFLVIFWWWKNVCLYDDMFILYYINCGGGSMCLVFFERYYLDDLRIKVIIFYGFSVYLDDFLLLRKVDYLWNLIYEELFMNNYMLFYVVFVELFNFIVMFRRELDYFLIS